MQSTTAAAPGGKQRLRQFFRFNLRSVLLLVAILCGFLAWASRDLHVAYRRQRLIAAVERLGGSIGWDERPPRDSRSRIGSAPSGTSGSRPR